MILIAVCALLLAFLRRDGMMTLLVLAFGVVPAQLLTEIRANGRRRRGVPMSGRARTVSVIQLTAALPLLLILAGEFAACILNTLVPR